MVRYQEIERLTRIERRWTRVAIGAFTLFFTAFIVLMFELRRELLFDQGRNLTFWTLVCSGLLISGVIIIFIKLRLKEIKMMQLHKFYDEE